MKEFHNIIGGIGELDVFDNIEFVVLTSRVKGRTLGETTRLSKRMAFSFFLRKSCLSISVMTKSPLMWGPSLINHYSRSFSSFFLLGI